MPRVGHQHEERPQRGRLIVVSGPSGVGKNTIVRRVIEELPWVGRVLTATTREPGQGEEDGRDYEFISLDQFKILLRKARLVEYALYVGHYYGTPRRNLDEALETRRAAALVIDVRGASQIKRQNIPATFVFIAPPDIQTLRDRLAQRCREDPESIEPRLARAKEELVYRNEYDHVIVNDDLEKAVAELREIVVSLDPQKEASSVTETEW